LPATASGVSRRVPVQIAPEDVSAPDAATLAGRKGIRIVLPGEPKQLAAAPEEPQAPAATTEVQPAAAAPVKVTQSKIADLVGRGLGNEPAPKPVPGKPIYSRPTPTPATAPTVPEGMTAVKSNGMRAYSYDAPTQTFTAQWPDGSLHRYGEVTPEEVQAFEAAESKGRALLEIKNNHVHVGANYGHGWVNKAPVIRSATPDVTPGAAAPPKGSAAGASPVSQSAPQTAVPDDLTTLLQQSVEAANRGKPTRGAK
jgi:hypothetical protein